MNNILKINGEIHELKPAIPNGQDSCSSCMYSKFAKLSDEQGACHCNPPSIITVPQSDRLTGQMSLTVQSFFPIIKRDVWCGAYEPAFEGIDDKKA
jgi:hypothetical protein